MVEIPGVPVPSLYIALSSKCIISGSLRWKKVLSYRFISSMFCGLQLSRTLPLWHVWVFQVQRASASHFHIGYFLLLQIWEVKKYSIGLLNLLGGRVALFCNLLVLHPLLYILIHLSFLFQLWEWVLCYYVCIPLPQAVRRSMGCT